MIHVSMGFFFSILVSYVSVPSRITAEKSSGCQVCAKSALLYIAEKQAHMHAHIQVQRIQSKNRAVFERQDHKVNFEHFVKLHLNISTQ